MVEVAEPRAPGRARSWLVGVVVAGCMVAVAAGAAAAAGVWRGGGQPPGYVGRVWTLGTVSHAGVRTPVPAAVGATVELAADGTLRMRDGVNFLGARYTLTPDGFTVGEGTSTLVGYAGTDPGVLAAVAGIGALSASQSASPPGVTARQSTAGLSLETGGYLLELVPGPRG